MFDKEQDGHYNKKYPFAAGKLFYNAVKDVYICPMGQEMEYQGNVKKVTLSGFEQISRKYQAKNCGNCPLNGACHKSKTNRIIEVNVDLKTQNKERMKSSIANKASGTEKKGVMM